PIANVFHDDDTPRSKRAPRRNDVGDSQIHERIPQNDDLAVLEMLLERVPHAPFTPEARFCLAADNERKCQSRDERAFVRPDRTGNHPPASRATLGACRASHSRRTSLATWSVRRTRSQEPRSSRPSRPTSFDI